MRGLFGGGGEQEVIVAISAVELLKAFVVSGVLFAVTDRITEGKGGDH